MKRSMSRAQLMARAQNGDHEAFNTLLKDIGPHVTSSLERWVFDISEIEDICQEVMIAVYKSRHSYQPDRPFEPWLFAIIRNVTRKHIRRNQERMAVEMHIDDLPELPFQGSWALEIELRQALEHLSPTQIEAFSMTKLLGLSLAEAAQCTGASIGAIKVRAHRASEALKKSLRD
jgi:RNA polymerase sigma-70 factor (ECF subfamily)